MRRTLPLGLWPLVCLLACGDTPDPTPSPTAGVEPTPTATPTATSAPAITAAFDTRLQTGTAETFFDFPWPSDARLLPGGQPDLEGFPQDPQATLLDLYVDVIETSIVGFGNNSPAYFRFSGPIAATNLPTTARDGARDDCPLLLIDVDPTSPNRGERLPVRAYVFDTPTAYNPPHLLAVGPVWGFPMRAGTTYAAVVLRGLGDADGRPLGVPEALTRLAAGQPQDGEEGLAALYAPLWSTLDEVGVAREDVAAATVFTTQDPIGELGHIRDWLLEQPAPVMRALWHVPADPDVESIGAEEASYAETYEADPASVASGYHGYWLFEGRYESPNFQSGEAPYTEEGGAILFDEAGDPIVQFTEDLRFALTVPKGEAPPGGWPLVLFAHGTGGDYKNFMYNRGFAPADLMAARGVAMMSIDEPLHGPRGPEGTDEELSSFNFFNPDAARSNFRQAAIDVFWELRVAREALQIPAEISPTGAAVRFDPARVAFMGHSHGGLSGGLLFPFEGDLRGAMLSGAGGGLALTILNRKDYVDFEDLFRTLLYMEPDDVLNSSHTVMGLVQLLVDVTDPINYAPHYFRTPLSGVPPRGFLQSEGFFDAATPPVTIEAMAAAAGLPILNPLGRVIPGLILRGVPAAEGPLTGNLSDGAVTAALAQFPYEGHSAVFRDADGASLVADFLASVLDGAPGTVGWGDPQLTR